MKHLRCLWILAAGTFFAAACAAQPSRFLDGIAATVNNSVITYLQVQDQIIRQIPPDIDSSNFPATVRQLQKDELESMEQSKLILDDFARGEYTTNWVDDAVEEVIKSEIKNKFSGNRNKLIKTLQAEGRTYEDYKKQQRENVIVENLLHLHAGSEKIVISPAAIEEYYTRHLEKYKVEDRVKLRVIQIPESAGSRPGDARKMAEEILQEIDRGATFAEMATVYSTGSQRADWKDRKTLRKELADVAFSLKPGEHSQVVEVPGEGSAGAFYDLLMVDEVSPAHATPLSDVQGEIEQELRVERGKYLEDQWIKRLEAKSRINTY
jgi:peptidyl-prolyl cis-trans isomerase SurA